MKKRTHLLSSLATLAFVAAISWGSALNAQTTPTSTPADQQPQAQQPSPDATPAQQAPQTQPAPSKDAPAAAQQTPSTTTPDQTQTPAAAPSQAPSSQTSTPAATDSQVFAGTIVKSGDKYMLKDDSGKSYDIDHQDDVKKFEGKRVRVQGALDPSGTKILVH